MGCGGEPLDDAGSFTEDETADTRTFVPEGLTLENLGTNNTLTLVAGTLRTFSDGTVRWLVSVRNNGPEIVCDLDVRAILSDARGVDSGVVVAFVRSPLYQAKGWVEPCLMAGEVGTGDGVAELYDGVTLAAITHVTYLSNGVVRKSSDLGPPADITVQDVRAQTLANGKRLVKGRAENQTGVALESPGIFVYSLNSVGRPLSFGAQFGASALAPSAAWDFALTMDAPFTSAQVFVDDYSYRSDLAPFP